MNWPKMKTYLIILLVIANVLMIPLLFTQNEPEAPSFDLKPVMIEKMAKEGIIVPSSPFDHLSEIEAVVISNKALDLNEEKAYFEALGLKSSYTNTSSAYIYSLGNDGKLTIDYYNENLGEEDIVNLSEADALELAKTFLPEPKFDLSYSLYSLSREAGRFEFHFEELYKNQPLPDGYIRITIEGDKVVKLIKSELDAKSKGHVKIIPYDLALYRLYSTISKDDLPIEFTRVDIVRKMEAIASDTKLITADTFPYYRFVSEKGSFLVKALAED